MTTRSACVPEDMEDPDGFVEGLDYREDDSVVPKSEMNAFHGTDYDIQKFANVSFEGSGDFRNSAQVVNAKWGNYDAYGLMAFSYSDTSGAGYAFAMNTFHMASTLASMLTRHLKDTRATMPVIKATGKPVPYPDEVL